jgi:hypothetical protein
MSLGDARIGDPRYEASMDRTTAVMLGVVGFVGVVAVALFLGAGLGGIALREETSEPGPVTAMPDPPADGSHGYVMGVHKTRGGWKVFGWQVISDRYQAHVGFAPPDGCDVSQGGTLVAEGDCAGALVTGEITGGGTTRAGVRFVIVGVPISNGCYEVLNEGVRWPPEHEACR